MLEFSDIATGLSVIFQGTPCERLKCLYISLFYHIHRIN